MQIDGRKIASDLLTEVREKRARLPSLVVRAITVAPTASTQSYLRTKAARAQEAGMTLEVVQLPDSANTNDVLQEIEREGADALLVQLPLPAHIDTPQVLNSIPLVLDADVLSKAAQEAFVAQTPGAVLPPVVRAVAEILARSGVCVSERHVVVVGNGRLVGAPVAVWMEQQGAIVTVVTKEEGDLSILKAADIVILGAGSPKLITPDMISPGVVLIDAGTSESNGAIVGDAAPECADIADVFTPVPGGVGPVAVACLFRNAEQLVSGD